MSSKKKISVKKPVKKILGKEESGTKDSVKNDKSKVPIVIKNKSKTVVDSKKEETKNKIEEIKKVIDVKRQNPTKKEDVKKEEAKKEETKKNIEEVKREEPKKILDNIKTADIIKSDVPITTLPNKISKKKIIEKAVEVKEEKIIIPVAEEINIEHKKDKIEAPKIEEAPKILEATPAPIIKEVAVKDSEEIMIEKEIAPLVREKKPSKTEKLKLEGQSDMHDDKNKVEALLFACGKYIEDTIISELCDIEKRQLKKVLEELRNDYESKDTALMIFNEGNSWKINVREKYLSIVRKIVADTELPRSVMETLAVIAWKTPINQSEVVKIRGNKCYDHIEVLETAGFVSKDKKGRSYVLKATDKFYTYFEIDHGNMKGLFDTVKIPEIKEEQQTLESSDLIKEDEVDKINAIELKKWTETDEEKEGHKQFLSQIENKILEARAKNELLAQEIPRPGLARPIEEAIPVQENVAIQEENLGVQDNLQDQNVNPQEGENVTNETQSLVNVEPQADNPAKPKSLTKKQLEKKFRDELLRVREKMENKK